MALSLIQRLARMTASLAAVAAAYWLYALVAVPWIEPAAVRGDSPAGSGYTSQDASDKRSQRRSGVARWFPDGAWQRTSPKIVETPQGKLLFKDYRNLKGGRRVKLEPCTMIFLPSEQAGDEEERQRRAVILDAPDGAVVEFDEPFDPKRGKMGRLIGGELVGQITISSMQRLEGPEDDLRITARDIVMAEDRITSVHPVDFRLGDNRGSGRGLLMELAGDQSPDGRTGIGSVTSFELTSQVHMVIQPAGGDFFPGAAPAPPPRGKPQPPVDVTCLGPFRFDLIEYVATFTDQVDVLRLQAEGPGDRLMCQMLSIAFEADAVDRPDAPTGIPKLRPSRVIATGSPVRVDSPSNNVHAIGQRLEYDVQNRGGKLSGGNEVSLIQVDPRDGARQEIHARELRFEPDPNNPTGRLGIFLASGAGWLQADAPPPSAGRIDARWTESLHFRPHDQQQLLSVKGLAEVELADTGALSGDEIHLWLRQPAGGPGSSQAQPAMETLTPDRLLARGGVRIRSPQLDGTVERLEVWFVEAAPAATQTANPSPQSAAAVPGDQPPPSVAAGNPRAPSHPAARPQGAQPPRPAGPQAIEQRFRITGELLQIEVAMGGEQAEIRQLVIDRQVRCEETRTRQPDEKPLVMEGDRLDLVQDSPDSARVTITGQPAKVDGRGMTLQAGTAELAGAIELDQAGNRLWIDGEGSLALAGGGRGQAPADQPLLVTWQGRMDFDGLAAHFTRDVLATQRQQDPRKPETVDERMMRTETLEVRFVEPVRFDQENANPPLIDVVDCRGGAYLESRSFESRRQAALVRMKARDLAIAHRSGEVIANGPGWVTHVNRGGLDSLAGLPRQPANRPVVSSQAELSYLDIHFDRQLTGNLWRRVMRFHQNVHAVHGPVGDWEGRLDPDRPGEQGFILNCDTLEVAQNGTDAVGSAAYLMTAAGSTVVEGSTFTARALWLSYDTLKGHLVLEGDGTTDAQLARQTRIGGAASDLSARKIQYWPSSGHAIAEDFGSADLSDLTGIKPSR